MSWEMAEVYGAVTDQILINLAKHFRYYKPGEPVPKSSFEYQARMLAQMGQVNRETIQIIRNNLDGADEALKSILEQAIIDAVSKAEPELLDAVKKGVLSPAGIPIVSPNQMRAYQLYYQQASDKLNLVNTVMLESTKSAYQQTITDVVSGIELAERLNATQQALDIAAGETITGVSSWNQALRHATERMANRGIVGFVDHGGHRWSAEAYAAMDIRTTVANTARAAVWETNENFGNDLYQVSYHNGARPLCYPWQSKVISSTDNARTVTDLDGNEITVYAQSATSYGQAAGLFGINCKHYPTPFIPGVSLIRDGGQSPEENEKTYEESQQQRALERKIREQKRDLDMMKAQGADPEQIKAQRAKIRETDDEIDAFCDATGRARRQNREGVYTKRQFPDADKYDVEKFEHEQQDRIREFYEKGGAQQGRTFGEMTQKEQTSNGQVKRRRELMTAEEQRAEWARIEAEKAAQGQTAKQAQQQAEDAMRKDAIAEYDKQIAKLERKRLSLIESGSEDFAKTDKLSADVEKLEARKKTLESGGWTIDQAKKTVVENYIVNPGSEAQVVLAKADVYTTPDGKRFVFKHGMNRSHQTLTPDTLIETYYKTPAELREKAQSTINVVDVYNPKDKYWRKTYKDFTHSYMTGGEQITVYRTDYEHDLDYLQYSLDHEMGHGIDRLNSQGGQWFSAQQEWQEAMQKDKEVSGKESWTEYGKNSPSEDFAESVAGFYKKRDAFTEKMPNRTALLTRLLYGGNST
jgi:hypothetical protein